MSISSLVGGGARSLNLVLSLFDFIRALRPNYSVSRLVCPLQYLFEGVPIEAEITAKAHEKPSDAKRATKKVVYGIVSGLCGNR